MIASVFEDVQSPPFKSEASLFKQEMEPPHFQNKIESYDHGQTARNIFDNTTL